MEKRHSRIHIGAHQQPRLDLTRTCSLQSHLILHFLRVDVEVQQRTYLGVLRRVPSKGFTGRTPRQKGSINTSQNIRFLLDTSRYIFCVARDGHLKAESWDHILQLYTARNLTNPHDKLPALSAMAQRYSQSTGADYLAGLWKPTFRQDLLWQHHPSYPYITVSDGGNPMRGGDYRAPSWSWAAVDGVILSHFAGKTLNSSQSTEYAWLTEVATYPTPVLVNPQNIFGGVDKMSTELQLRGPIETFKVLEYRKQNTSVGIILDHDVCEDWCLSVDDHTETAAWRGRETEPLIFLHLLIQNRSDSIRSIYSSALLPVHDRHHTYIRIGRAHVYSLKGSISPSTFSRDIETVIIL